MKLDFWKSLTSLEIVLIVLLVIYIVFAIPTPDTFIPFMNSSVGFAIVVIVVIFMVYYTNPILAILSIFVGYELIRRSSYNTMNNNIFSVPVVQSFPINQLEKDVIMKEMNPLQSVTLEEEVINKMAPIGIMDTATFIETSYQPLPDKTVDCAAYYKCSE